MDLTLRNLDEKKYSELLERIRTFNNPNIEFVIWDNSVVKYHIKRKIDGYNTGSDGVWINLKNEPEPATDKQKQFISIICKVMEKDTPVILTKKGAAEWITAHIDDYHRVLRDIEDYNELTNPNG